jgi:hypothetical protein
LLHQRLELGDGVAPVHTRKVASAAAQQGQVQVAAQSRVGPQFEKLRASSPTARWRKA